MAAWRRWWRVLAVAAVALVWLIIEIGFSVKGYPSVPRYMYEAGAVMVVIAAVGIGRLLAEPPATTAVLRVGAIVLAVAVTGALVPAAISRARNEHKDLRVQRERTKTINRLSGVVSKLGGPGRLRACGEPLTRLRYQTVVAWTLRVNVATVGYKYARAIARGAPIVLFTPGPRGWKVQALHQRLDGARDRDAYLTTRGTASEPTTSRTIMAAPTTTSRTRSLVK